MRSEIIRDLSELCSGCCYLLGAFENLSSRVMLRPTSQPCLLSADTGWPGPGADPSNPRLHATLLSVVLRAPKATSCPQLSPCFLKAVAAASEAALLSPVVPARVQTFPPWQGVVGGGRS